jgi:hypothetical protein
MTSRCTPRLTSFQGTNVSSRTPPAGLGIWKVTGFAGELADAFLAMLGSSKRLDDLALRCQSTGSGLRWNQISVIAGAGGRPAAARRCPGPAGSGAAAR